MGAEGGDRRAQRAALAWRLTSFLLRRLRLLLFSLFDRWGGDQSRLSNRRKNLSIFSFPQDRFE